MSERRRNPIAGLGLITAALAQMPAAAQRHMEKQMEATQAFQRLVPAERPPAWVESIVPDRVRRAAEKRARKADRRRGAR